MRHITFRTITKNNAAEVKELLAEYGIESAVETDGAISSVVVTVDEGIEGMTMIVMADELVTLYKDAALVLADVRVMVA